MHLQSIDNELQHVFKTQRVCIDLSYAGFFANRVTYIVLSSSKPLFNQGNPFRILRNISVIDRSPNKTGSIVH